MARAHRMRSAAPPAIIATSGVLAVGAAFTFDIEWLILAVGIGALVALWIDTRDRVIEQRVAPFTAPRPDRPSVEDYMGFGDPERVVFYQPAPEPETSRARARVSWDEVTGEVVEPYSRELEQGEALVQFPAPDLNNAPRQIEARR